MSLGHYFVKSPIIILTILSQYGGIWLKYCDIYSFYHLSLAHLLECTTSRQSQPMWSIIIDINWYETWLSDRFFSCIAKACVVFVYLWLRNLFFVHVSTADKQHLWCLRKRKVHMATNQTEAFFFFFFFPVYPARTFSSEQFVTTNKNKAKLFFLIYFLKTTNKRSYY